MIDILIPYFNYLAGVQLIQNDLANSHINHNLIIANDSVDSHLNDLPNWVAGPQKGAVRNWNFLLEKNQAKKFILVHQDERIITRTKKSNLFNDNDVIYVTDLVILSKGRKIFLSGKVRALLMNYFPSLIYHVNFIGPTASLVIPKNSLRFNTKLNWLVDVDYYWQLRQSYKYKYTPLLITVSDTTSVTSITNSGKLGKINDVLSYELKILKKKKRPIWQYLTKITWHIYRIINTRYL